MSRRGDVHLRRVVAEDAGTLAALNRFVQELHLSRRPDYFKPAQTDDVVRWSRGKGLGTRLLERALTDARERGLADIELNTWAFNDVAQTTFRRLGLSPRTIRFERSYA